MKQRKTVSYAKYGYLFSLPFVIAFLLFMLYPICYTAFIGFTDLEGPFAEIPHILEDPWENFRKLLDNDSFKTSLKNTFSIWIANFIPQMGLALVLAAWFTNDRMKIKGKGFFKVVFYMPNIITAATVAILFGSLFGYPKGPINDLLMQWNVLDEPHYFGMDKFASQAIVAFIQFWQWYGYTMIVLISGILGISPDIFEAAEIDGANGFQKFMRVTLPNLKTIMLFTLVTSLIGGLTMFDIPRLYNNGFPDNATLTANLFIYKAAFEGKNRYNSAAAASMILFAIIVVLSAGIFFLLRDKDEVAARKAERARVKDYKRRMRAKRREEAGE